jgi:protocatechuate 3,4-dioxygenase beta subunit
MRITRNSILLAPLFFILFGYSASLHNDVQVVEGTVVGDKGGKPVANAHVYIIDGEEEALTNARGEFSIRTAQKFPLRVTAEHKDHQKASVVISNAGQKQVIRLQTR